MKTKLAVSILCLLATLYFAVLPPRTGSGYPNAADTIVAHRVLDLDTPDLETINKPVDDKIETLRGLNKSINRDSKNIEQTAVQIQKKAAAIQIAPTLPVDTVVILLPADSVPIKQKGFFNRIRSLFQRK